jgi:hypothetical protein
MIGGNAERGQTEAGGGAAGDVIARLALVVWLPVGVRAVEDKTGLRVGVLPEVQE